MSYDTIRDYLKTTLEAIDSVGVVEDYFRFLKSKNVKLELFKDNTLNALFIRKINEGNNYAGPGMLEKTHIVNLIVAMAINDEAASEKTFLSGLDDIMTALHFDYSLGDLVYQLKAPALTKHTHQGFAGTLCHYAIIELQLTEKINVC